ncbi:MAG: trigger factor [Aaplasma endosymbiont of Hyalomma asiaticum]
MQQFYSVREVLNEKLKRRYEFSVNSGYLEDKVEEKLQSVAANTRMDGFRKGKVSADFVRRTYGTDITNEVVSQVVDDLSSEFLRDKKFEDIVTSNVEVTTYPKIWCSDKAERNDLVYELEFELMPEVPAINLEEITLREIKVQITDQDIENFLEELKTSYPSFIPVEDDERAVSVGDQITVSYHSAYRGKAIRGGSAKGFIFILGKGSLLKEFEDQVVGMKRGESKEFKLKFPVDYAATQFAGKEVDMTIQVESFRTKEDIVDKATFASRCGFKDVDSMIEFAKKGLGERFTSMSNFIAQREMLDHMDSVYDVDVPEFIVSQEIVKVRQEVEQKKGSNEVDSAEVEKEARRRVKLGIILMKVASDSGVVVETDDVLSFLKANFASYGRSVDAVLKLFRSRRDFRDHVKGKVLEDKVVRYIISKVKRDVQSMSAEELKALF